MDRLCALVLAGDFESAQAMADDTWLDGKSRNLHALIDIYRHHGAGRWHGVLGIEAHVADTAALKKAYRSRGLLVHPDKLDCPLAHEAFSKLTDAVHRMSQGESALHAQTCAGSSPPEAHAWWSEWQDECATAPGGSARTGAASADRAQLEGLSRLQLEAEVVQRRHELMRGLSRGAAPLELQQRLARARSALAAADRPQEGASIDAATMDRASEALGGFFH